MSGSRVQRRTSKGKRYELSFRELFELKAGVLGGRTVDGKPVSAFPDEETAREAYLLNQERVESTGNRRAGHRSESWWRWIAPEARLTREVARAEFDVDGDFDQLLKDERLFWLAEHDLIEPWEIELLEEEVAGVNAYVAHLATRSLEIIAQARAEAAKAKAKAHR